MLSAPIWTGSPLSWPTSWSDPIPPPPWALLLFWWRARGARPAGARKGSIMNLPQTVLALLNRAHRRLDEGWCQGAYAYDADGRETQPEGATACEWCLMGALHAAAFELVNVDGVSKAEQEAALAGAVAALHQVLKLPGEQRITPKCGWQPERIHLDRAWLVNWNEASDRTAAQVRAAVAAAIEVAAAELVAAS